MALTVKVVVLVLGVGFGSCLAPCQSYKNTQYILVPVVAQFFFFFFKLGSLPAIDLFSTGVYYHSHVTRSQPLVDHVTWIKAGDMRSEVAAPE